MPERAKPARLAAPTLEGPLEAWAKTLADLRAIPQNPKSVTGSDNWFNGVQLMLDYLSTVPPRMQKVTAPLRRYPKPFRQVSFQTSDDVRLSGWLGIARDETSNGAAKGARRDALLLIPGLYTSKDNPRIRARARRVLQEWGFHVLALDLRGVGASERVYTTPGVKEAQDIIDAIRFLRENANVARVHLYAESLAASAALVAVGLEAQNGRRLLDGRVVSVSPYASAQRIVDLYSTRTPEKTPLGKDFAIVQRFFNGLLRMQGYKGGRFDDYMRDGAAHYGFDGNEYLCASSPSEYVATANVLTLVLHSTDDGLVPVAEAEELISKASHNPHTNVWILPWGYHCLYEMADPDWYWSVLARVYDAPTRVPVTRA